MKARPQHEIYNTIKISIYSTSGKIIVSSRQALFRCSLTSLDFVGRSDRLNALC